MTTDFFTQRVSFNRRINLCIRNERDRLLFAAACASHVVHVAEEAWPDNADARIAVQVTTAFALRQASRWQLRSARRHVHLPFVSPFFPEPAYAAVDAAFWAACGDPVIAAESAMLAAKNPERERAWQEKLLEQFVSVGEAAR